MEIVTGSDFSGVGAFDYAVERVTKKTGHTHKRVFACDWDKFARISYIAVHGEPEYYPKDVYDREIPSDPLDIYMTSPPCQSFSIAGKRGGKDDERGILFFNSHEFIKKNKPKTFIFENVKGLLSDDKHNPKDEHGRTFREWLNYLGGKSINGVPVIFPDENSVPYHIYWTVMNSKEHGVPQNRERVFIVGIRDDEDNSFSWPRTESLTKRLKDILEIEVDPKYFLSDKAINKLLKDEIDTDHLIPGEVNNTIRVGGGGGSVSAKHSFDMIKVVGNTNPSGNGMNGNVYDSDGISPTLSTNKGEGVKIKVNSGVKKGFEEAGVYDSINFERPTSKTRKGRVGKQVAQTIDTKMHQSVLLPNVYPEYKIPLDGESSEQYWERMETFEKENGIYPSGHLCIPVLTPDRPNKRQNGRRFKEDGDPSFTITTQDRHGIFDGYQIRRLIPLECFRLQDFPDSHVEKCKSAGVSDSQLYKQAGNSITVRVLELIIEKLILAIPPIASPKHEK